MPDSVVQARALRALAHPLRLDLLRIATAEGAITSTSAAERTGESRANCSFHLRLLSKYGFLEVGPAPDRRERPWRAVTSHPLASFWRQLDESTEAAEREQSEFMRRQLRLFNVDDLQQAA